MTDSQFNFLESKDIERYNKKLKLLNLFFHYFRPTCEFNSLLVDSILIIVDSSQ